MGDDDYDAFVEQALKTAGTQSDVVTRTQAGLLVGVRSGTIRKWVQRGYLRALPGGGYRRVDVLAAASRNSSDEGDCEMGTEESKLSPQRVYSACADDGHAV